jgi:hypothetical protein
VPELTLAWSEGWLWLSGSLLLAALWANLAWFFRQPRAGAIDGFVTRLAAWRFAPGLFQLLRLLYYVGIPFAALLWGHDAVVGRLLGLQQFELPVSGGEEASVGIAANWLDWALDAGWTVTVGVGAWGLLALGWWAYRRAVVVGQAQVAAGEIDGASEADSSGWVFLREAAYHEVHWAFYRNAPILAAGTYWGVWIGLALAALEAALNPAWRRGLADPRRAPGQLVRAALAVVSSVSFLLTENLWLALILDWGVSWGWGTLARVLAVKSTTTPVQSTPPT